MRNGSLPLLAGLLALGLLHEVPVDAVMGSAQADPRMEVQRELLVPFEELHILLEGTPERVLLTRDEYVTLLEAARIEEKTRPPRDAAVIGAEYAIEVESERAVIRGTLAVELLTDDLHAVPLEMSGVGIARAALDGRPAALGQADSGAIRLFARGRGVHGLELELTAPVETSAARQVLNLQLPVPPATQLRLAVPGDVEIKSGAAVVERRFNAGAERTEFVLLPTRGPLSLVMTLNSRLQRTEQIVVARTVLLDEVTQAYERLHATLSLEVLHRPVLDFSVALDPSLEVTEVESPLLARWSVRTEPDRKVLELRLREEMAGTAVLGIAALKPAPALGDWSLPRFEPLGVAGHSAVIGLLLEDRLQLDSAAAPDLIPIDVATIAQAIPASFLADRASAIPVRPVLAYYAPRPQCVLRARLSRPPAELLVTTNVLLILENAGQQVQGGFTILPRQERLFAVDFSVPPGWDLTSVADGSGAPLPFDRYPAAAEREPRVRVRLPQGVPPGSESSVYFRAVRVPKGWLEPWSEVTTDLPVFAVSGATRDTGAVAVEARDEFVVRPQQLEQLTPLDDKEKEKYGLGTVATSLAYRYDAQPYAASLAVERTAPRLTARTYSFYRFEHDALVARYELTYDITRAPARELLLRLPRQSPGTATVTGLDGLAVKESYSEERDSGRHWTVRLAEGRIGTARVAIDLQQPLSAFDMERLQMSTVVAEGTAYQSGFLALEGSPDLEITVIEPPRSVDVGELVDAQYQPGSRLLGVFGFVGDGAELTVQAAARAPYELPPAIVGRAEQVTLLSGTGLAQTDTRLMLQTRAPFLAIELPAASTLWSASLDGRPLKPQREGDRILLSLPVADGAARQLAFVYETRPRRGRLPARVALPAARLFVHAGTCETARELPLADLDWRVFLPSGFEAVRIQGLRPAGAPDMPPLAARRMAESLYRLAGGIDFDRGLLGRTLLQAGEEARSAMTRGGAPVPAEMPPELGLTLSREAFAQVELAEPAAPPPARALGREEGAQQLRRSVMGPQGEPARQRDRPSLAVAEPRMAEPAAAGEAEVDREAPQAGAALDVLDRADAARLWSMQGLRALPIELDEAGCLAQFTSLGGDRRLELTLINRRRLASLGTTLAFALVALGFGRTRRSFRSNVGYVIAIGAAATALPLLTGRPELAIAANPPCYAAAGLLPWYALVALVRRVLRPGRAPAHALSSTSAAALLALLAGAPGAGLRAEAPAAGAGFVVQLVEPEPPVTLPEDAVVRPYNPEQTGTQPLPARGTDQILVSQSRYIELWNRAHPDERLGDVEPPVPYALAGAAFQAELAGEDDLIVEGHCDIELFSDRPTEVTLPLAGGVLTAATVDGQSARVRMVAISPDLDAAIPDQAQPQQRAQQAEPMLPDRAGGLVGIYLSGRGSHRLDLALRMHLERRGGWRIAAGRLPAAPATALLLRVPRPGTEVRLGAIADRASYETEAANQEIATALAPSGAFRVEWRPRVAEGEIDQALTAESTARLEVNEERLDLSWTVRLAFARGERERFALQLPPRYVVRSVTGTNVRGWEIEESASGESRLDVLLLRPARESEEITISLWRPGPAAGAEPEPFDAPAVGVEEAVLHRGTLVVYRSPLLELRSLLAEGVTRADLPPARADAAPAPGAVQESPLGLRAYQAYQFPAAPFRLRLAATPIAPRLSVNVQTILRIGQRQRRLEARALLTIQDRACHRIQLTVPAELRDVKVSAPAELEWALNEGPENSLLNVFLSTGVVGELPLVVQGTLGPEGAAEELPIPRLAVIGVDRQQGEIVIQADPAYEVRTGALSNIEPILLDRVQAWLAPEQRALAQAALRYRSPDYGGSIRLEARRPDVSGITLTNIRVTDRAVEETILLDLNVAQAGVRELAFTLPASMADARVSVPLLRQKEVTPVEPAAAPDGRVRVRLELQDLVMGQVRVLVEQDRVLTSNSQVVPLPIVETGKITQHFVGLENAGRDELKVVENRGFAPLGRLQKEWATVSQFFRGSTTDAFVLTGDPAAASLTVRTEERPAVKTAGARIGLAQSLLVLDAQGTYRAEQRLRIDNRIEQWLEIEIPEGAELWTASVAGTPVKPSLGEKPRQVRVPLVKTAAGDLDYEVVIKYGGRISRLGALSRIRFPLIRVLNIHVELSQARLLLPETHAWFDFGGTMRRIDDAGELAAEVVAYQGKQAERLIQALQVEDSFAQVRARANVINLKQQADLYQQTLAGFDDNEELQRAILGNSAIFAAAEQELEARRQQEGSVLGDNSGLIRARFLEQRNDRALGKIEALEMNWSETAQSTATAAPAPGGAFNRDWLIANGLVTAAGQVPAADEETAQPQLQQIAIEGVQVQNLDAIGAFNRVSGRAPAQPKAPQVAQGEFRKDLADAQQMAEEQRMKAVTAGKEAGLQERAARYQERLQQQLETTGQLQSAAPGQFLANAPATAPVSGPAGSIGAIGAPPTDMPVSVGFGAAPEAGTGLAQAVMPSGLASLEVELPQRGVEYLFTTPRGEARLTARAAKRASLGSMLRIVAAPLCIVLVALALWGARRLRTIAVLAPGRAALVTGGLGLLGLCAGILPRAGLLLLLAALARLAGLYCSRRRPLAAREC